MMRSPYRVNLALLYIMRAIRWFLLVMPILFVFYTSNNISMTQIFILQANCSLISVLCEIPSGYFSDRIGRRKTMILAAFFSFAGFFIYALPNVTFWKLLIAEAMMGIGMSFVSGTDDALFYDSLIELKEEHRYKKLNAAYQSVGNFSEAGAAIAGSLLATVFLRLPFIIEAAVVGALVPLSFALKEPTVVDKNQHSFSMKDMISIFRYSIFEHAELRILILMSATMGSATLIATWFVQPYWKVVQLPLVWFGVLWAGFNLSIGLFALMSNAFEKKFGFNGSIVLLNVGIIAVFVCMASLQALWAIPFLLLIYFVRGIQNPIFMDYINRIATSDKRATILSIKSLIFRLEFVALSPIIGVLTDKISLRFALLMAASVYAIAFAILIPVLYRKSPVR